VRHRCFHRFSFASSFAQPFGFAFHAGFGFPRRSEYLRMLEEYKQELEAELREVEQEIQELRGEAAPGTK
jgi:hypothetical protein